MTHFIIWLTAIVFIVQLVCGFFRWDVADADGRSVGVMQYLFALNSDRLLHGLIWQPLTYMLLHADLWHILINLMILWFFGREVEYFIGPKAYTKLYLLGGLTGAALWFAFNFGAPGYLLGASAAVLGCVIAFATLFPDREVTLLVFFVLPVTLRAKYIALIAVAVDIFPLLSRTDTNVAHLAHLGGAALGYVYIKMLGYGVTPGWLLALQDLQRKVRPPAKPKPENLSPEEFIRREIDPILDKISREGMQSLTRAERKILESAKDLMQKHRR